MTHRAAHPDWQVLAGLSLQGLLREEVLKGLDMCDDVTERGHLHCIGLVIVHQYIQETVGVEQ